MFRGCLAVEPTSDDRYTPPEILEAVAEYWPEGIDLDPFWSPSSVVSARRMIPIDPDDPDGGGFDAEWAGRIWVNGPWSRMLDVMRKVSRVDDGEVLVLCKLDTSTTWWRKYVWACADQICFLGRTRYASRSITSGGRWTYEDASPAKEGPVPPQLLRGHRPRLVDP